MDRNQENTRAVYIGLIVGGLAILGGIFMFIYVVPRDIADKGDVPRDLTLLFTNVFLEQMAHNNEKSRYAAAVQELKMPPQSCERYQCRLTVPPDGKSFQFRLTKDHRTWLLSEKSPVPKEIP